MTGCALRPRAGPGELARAAEVHGRRAHRDAGHHRSPAASGVDVRPGAAAGRGRGRPRPARPARSSRTTVPDVRARGYRPGRTRPNRRTCACRRRHIRGTFARPRPVRRTWARSGPAGRTRPAGRTTAACRRRVARTGRARGSDATERTTSRVRRAAGGVSASTRRAHRPGGPGCRPDHGRLPPVLARHSQRGEEPPPVHLDLAQPERPCRRCGRRSAQPRHEQPRCPRQFRPRRQRGRAARVDPAGHRHQREDPGGDRPGGRRRPARSAARARR